MKELDPISPPSGPALTFKGSVRGYYFVWLVNVLGTVLTLGLFWPWSRFRHYRYFVEQTELDGTRFEFHGKPFEAMREGFASALAVLVTLGLAGHVWYDRQARYFVKCSRYRGIRADFSATRTTFSRIGVAVVTVSVSCAGISVTSWAGLWMTPFFVLIASLGLALSHARVLNAVINHTRYLGFELYAQLRTGPVLWLMLTNFLLVVLSVGLLAPWAEVRLWRYWLRHIRVTPAVR